METATKAGRYEILGELGRGGMGVVYRAKDPLIGRIVATKTLRLSEEDAGMSHAELTDYFQTEAQAAGRLTHPNIVAIYDVGESDGVYYITMELVNGKSLQSMLDSGEKFPATRLLRIMEQICSALEFAHHNGVVHRDIKPANIMLTKDDFVKITDFGTAKILQYGASRQSEVMGTPAYMSPEQIRGKAVNERTDIFSLGVMLYEMSTGQKPFQGKDTAEILYRILHEEPMPPHQVNPSISLGVSSTIMKALTKSPFLRYESCGDLLEDLKHYRPGQATVRPNDEPRPTIKLPQHAIREKADKNDNAQAVRTVKVEASSNPPVSNDNSGSQFHAESGNQAAGVYAGPTAWLNLARVRRLATIAGGVLLAGMLGSFAVKTLTKRADSDVPPATQDISPSSTEARSEETGSVQRPPNVTKSNPEVATLGELAQPWSSKRFFFRSSTAPKYTAALIIRLPGPASASRSYWAFSLEAPFSQCEFAYIDDVEKLSSEYGFTATHPMVVNPCSHSVFDPVQMKELPGSTLVRGAIVKGYDLRPPYAIDVKVKGNQIQALAME
jgi:serine/threonine protein kinase